LVLTLIFARPDLGASARILLASIIASIPSTALVQLYMAGTGLVHFIAGGLFVLAYLSLAPILGAVTRQDIDNPETILCRTRAVAFFIKPVLAYETRIRDRLKALGYEN